MIGKLSLASASSISHARHYDSNPRFLLSCEVNQQQLLAVVLLTLMYLGHGTLLLSSAPIDSFMLRTMSLPLTIHSVLSALCITHSPSIPVTMSTLLRISPHLIYSFLLRTAERRAAPLSEPHTIIRLIMSMGMQLQATGFQHLHSSNPV